MKYRKLRITWSVTCGVLCLLLIALWGLSYYRVCFMRLGAGRVLMSSDGEVFTLPWKMSPTFGGTFFSMDDVQRPHLGRPEHSLLGLGYEQILKGVWAVVPYWFLVLCIATIGFVPTALAARWRFSLRTLLIGTTV